jgi:DNA polymerase-3 subunit gamma/tau
MSQVLYRKYRSKDFDELIGQDQIVKVLKSTIENEKASHAYLFCGPRGTGKTSTARIFAKGLNCMKPKKGNPCGKCENCKLIEKGGFLDIIEVDAASNRGINEIRELKEKVAFAPGQGKYKIYIIDEVHMLTKEAFNAILKTLEEPPEQTIFILATTEVHKLPITILSRVIRFDFGLASKEDLEKKLSYILTEEGIKFEEDALEGIVKLARGSYRDAESALEKIVNSEEVAGLKKKVLTKSVVNKVLGINLTSEVQKLIEVLIGNQSISMMRFSEVLSSVFNSGTNPQQFLQELVDEDLDQIYLSYSDSNVYSSDQKKNLLKLASELQNLVVNYNSFLDPSSLIKMNLTKFAILSGGIDQSVVSKRDESQEKSQEEEEEEEETDTEIEETEKSEKTKKDEPDKDEPEKKKKKTVKEVKKSNKVSMSKPKSQKSGEEFSENQIFRKIKDEVRSKSPRLSAILNQSVLEGLGKGEYSLKVPYKFHLKQIEQVKNKKIILSSIHEMIGERNEGEDLEVHFELDESLKTRKPTQANVKNIDSQVQAESGSNEQIVEEIFDDLIS